jgi:uncharacterized membrane protein
MQPMQPLPEDEIFEPVPKPIKATLADIYYEFGSLFVVNVLWVLTSLLIITAPPAFAALVYSTNELARGESIGWRTFFEGFKKNLWVGWKWALINIVVSAIMLVNLQFYAQFDTNWSPWVRGVMIGVYFTWGLLNMYTMPMLIEQNKKSFRMALRNAAVLYATRPFVLLGVSLLTLALSILSIIYFLPAFVIILASVCSYLISRITIDTVKMVNKKAEQKAEEDKKNQGSTPDSQSPPIE